jgi:hypothetical protein
MKRILLLFCLMPFATHLANAEERSSSLTTQLGSPTISGYVDTSITWLGQNDPGPATGGGVDRFYDDGFVRVDATGNPGGYTWFWSYENATQIQGSFISFHSQALLDANTIQLVTDTYDLGGLFPPSAPYTGTFEGPGPVLPDAPFSRTITIVPEPSSFALATVTIVGAMVLRVRGGRVSKWRGGRHEGSQTEDF